MNRRLSARLITVSAFFAYAMLSLAAPAHADTQRERDAEQKAEAQQDQAETQADKDAAAKAPPPAIPGAQATGAVIPSDKAAIDLAPNEALFDAITRGDLTAARDAMNRGAQLDSKNVLGQTPIDAAIDLNRNAITFMLLSLRGSEGTGPGKPAAPVTQVASATPSHHKTTHHTKATLVSASVPPVANPGTPNPNAGFLGF